MADDADQIHLLVIEDSEDDADLLVRELERGGYRLQYRRVDTPEDLLAALADRDWDLVIADYTMPRFSGAEALSMVRGRSRAKARRPPVDIEGLYDVVHELHWRERMKQVTAREANQQFAKILSAVDRILSP